MRYLKVAGVLAAVYVLVGTILVYFDKDISALRKEFTQEGLSVSYNYEVVPLISDGNIREAIDMAYGGRLDRVIKERDDILKKKAVIMLGAWSVAVNTGELVPSTLSLYIPVKPWRLEF